VLLQLLKWKKKRETEEVRKHFIFTPRAQGGKGGSEKRGGGRAINKQSFLLLNELDGGGGGKLRGGEGERRTAVRHILTNIREKKKHVPTRPGEGGRKGTRGGKKRDGRHFLSIPDLKRDHRRNEKRALIQIPTPSPFKNLEKKRTKRWKKERGWGRDFLSFLSLCTKKKGEKEEEETIASNKFVDRGGVGK